MVIKCSRNASCIGGSKNTGLVIQGELKENLKTDEVVLNVIAPSAGILWEEVRKTEVDCSHQDMTKDMLNLVDKGKLHKNLH